MRRHASTVLVAALVAAWATQASAQFVRYIDDAGVAHYVEGFDRVPERYRDAAVVLNYRNAPAPPPGATSEKADRAGSGTVIRYTPGQPIMVDVRINGGASARLLLDTGADRTLISPRALAAGGVSLTRVYAQGQMASATGIDRVQFVVVNSLEIGEAKVSNLPVAAYEMPQSTGDGLLGRDFLDRFTVSIDSSRGVVTLTSK